MEKFSVLMSVYKNEKPEYLQLAIDSIVNQTVKPAEIVIVEDGKLTPQIDAVLLKCEQELDIIKLVKFDDNRGLGLALRDGVNACSYNLIARMDTDDIAKPNRFQKQLEYLEQHKNITLLGTAIEEFSSDVMHPDNKTILPFSHDEIIAFAKKRNPFRHMSVMLLKEAVLKSGNYRNFLWFEDYDLWVRMIQCGCETANLPDILVSVRADQNMFARRGGWKYLKQDMKFQKFLKDTGFVTSSEFIRNIIIRTIVRLVPNDIRTFFYKHALREKR